MPGNAVPGSACREICMQACATHISRAAAILNRRGLNAPYTQIDSMREDLHVKMLATLVRIYGYVFLCIWSICRQQHDK